MHITPLPLFVFFFIYLAVIAVVNGYETHYFELNITRESIDPDCSGYKGGKLLVNGQLPGPPIEVTTGDRVKMLVRNLLPKHDPIVFSEDSVLGGHSNDVAIHCHGIRQIGSNEADGVPFLTQDPIKPQDSYLYDFRVTEQAGTFFYHMHVLASEETVMGAFIVYESKDANPRQRRSSHDRLVAGPYHYDEERTIVMSEWWHNTSDEIAEYMLGPKFHGIPEAHSILLNGQTLYHPKHPKGPDCGGYSVISVDPEKTYRIRVIGAMVFRTLGFAIAHHDLTVIESDGTLLQPYDVPYLEMTPGQRFSILLRPATQNHKRQGDYTINTIRRYAAGVDPASNGMAILRYTSSDSSYDRPHHHQKASSDDTLYDGVSIFSTPHDKYKFPPDMSYWYWSKLRPVEPVVSVLKRKPSRTLILDTGSKKLPTGAERWYVNDVVFTDPKETLLTSTMSGKRQEQYRLPKTGAASRQRTKSISTTGYDPYLDTYPLEYMEVVDFVIQSTYVKGGAPCRSHPWHTHGHSFYELAYGSGLYDETTDGDLRNVPHPFLRDVVLVYPAEDLRVSEAAANGTVLPCGWTKIRLTADNPGFWATHCHNAFHMLMGMMFTMEIAPELLLTEAGKNLTMS